MNGADLDALLAQVESLLSMARAAETLLRALAQQMLSARNRTTEAT